METARERLARTVARMWQEGRGIGSLGSPEARPFAASEERRHVVSADNGWVLSFAAALAAANYRTVGRC